MAIRKLMGEVVWGQWLRFPTGKQERAGKGRAGKEGAMALGAEERYEGGESYEGGFGGTASTVKGSGDPSAPHGSGK